MAPICTALVGSGYIALCHGRLLAGGYPLAAEFDRRIGGIRSGRDHIPLRFFTNSTEEYSAHPAIAKRGVFVRIPDVAQLHADSDHDGARIGAAPFPFAQGNFGHALPGDRHSLDL